MGTCVEAIKVGGKMYGVGHMTADTLGQMIREMNAGNHAAVLAKRGARAL